ncbi:NADH-quinone oxidoreductase subunit L [Actinoplanes sp. SE50]|uniref:NADH-quinone oxidoreductase subunit 5 family protein n=1 Tax=unclassified Actinoplanes TaxID=2626549 RepID=UPI00023ED186|nr:MULTISPECIES: NADH-quinone oxidoreductase subunit L [unclassified Actinoplanes]AEV81642.1 NADH dehydrogenase I subunit L [Actinoplanes sp. SE50/110]ATO80043.1 NADH-quinone oxidoreductase subunit L [Actinoplanes sp. SE50]SLL97447.1 NADH-quinone oxidoreductase subunit L [Actinoplanes sp. SE50/110]
MTTDVLGALLPGIPLLLGLLGLTLRPGDGGPRRLAATLGIAGAALALLDAIALLAITTSRAAPLAAGTTWARFGDIEVTLGFAVGPAALYVALAVCVVALCVQVYSTTYLHDDPRYAPYAAQVALFTGAMLLVVSSGDLIGLLIGWEVMGACSYLLIGHDRRLPEAPAAAVKAFLVTRVGDVGFLLGIALLVAGAGTSRLSVVLTHSYGHGTLIAALLLLLAGVAGKSAQFPLHTWLPDAMAGPTPISALIHAATMVAAGVYVVFRTFPLFQQSPAALATLAVMSSITILLGALSAMAQDDMKRVLAWSTVSQIGYMTGALAVGSPAAALFHLLTHAAFKALLFLAAGAVIHTVGGNHLSRMGGLRTHMPVTFWSFVIGLSALAGLPPLAGFWSKENVLTAAAHATDGGGTAPVWAAWLVWVAALLGVGLTAWYATRLLLRAFFGPSRAHGPAGPHWEVGFDDARYQSPAVPHDPPGPMRWPILLLAIPAALLGLAAFAPGFRHALELDDPHLSVAILLPMLLLATGAGTAWWLWWAVPGADPAEALGRARPLFAAGFHLDHVQSLLVVRPAKALARFATAADERVVDAAVEGAGTATRGLGGMFADAHRASLPGAAVLVLFGALILSVVAWLGALG